MHCFVDILYPSGTAAQATNVSMFPKKYIPSNVFQLFSFTTHRRHDAANVKGLPLLGFCVLLFVLQGLYNLRQAQCYDKLSECRPAEEEALLVVCATELAQLYTTIAADKVLALSHVELSCHVNFSRHMLCMYRRPNCAEPSDTAAKYVCEPS